MSQRPIEPDRKGMGLIKAGVVLCLAAFLFGSIAMVVGAMSGDGEDAPKIFQQMAGASCGLFALGLVLSLVGWLLSLNKSEPPKPTAASRGVVVDLDEQANEQADQAKPDPYASEHRRRDD